MKPTPTKNADETQQNENENVSNQDKLYEPTSCPSPPQKTTRARKRKRRARTTQATNGPDPNEWVCPEKHTKRELTDKNGGKQEGGHYGDHDVCVTQAPKRDHGTTGNTAGGATCTEKATWPLTDEPDHDAPPQDGRQPSHMDGHMTTTNMAGPTQQQHDQQCHPICTNTDRDTSADDRTHTGNIAPGMAGTTQHCTDTEQDADDSYDDISELGDGDSPEGPRPPPSPAEYQSTLDRIWPHPVTDQWDRHQDYRDIYNEVRRTALPNYMQAKIPIPSRLNIPEWRRQLTGYHDKQLVDFLEFGWPADYTADKPPTTTIINHREDPAHMASIQDYVRTETNHGALLGPFDKPPFAPWSQSSPMMTRPKKNSSNRRVIVDLSWPRAESVNTGIKRGFYQGEPRAYTLPNIMSAADEVARLGTGCYLWCADLARAYRQLRTCPLSTPLLGITLDGRFYTDIAPPFGCRTSSMACARTTNAVVYLMRKKKHHVHCYLDDFVGVAATKQQADRAYADFTRLAAQLGLELSPSKCIPPTKEIEWLGFHISATNMTVTIPRTKLEEILIDCQEWMTKTTTTKKGIQKLAGKLQHIARCVEPARRFMSRIFNALREAPATGRTTVQNELRSDIRWFLQYAQTTNGLVLLEPETKEPWTIECDSCMKAGGAFSATHYYTQDYPDHIVDRHTNIAHLEAINLLVALKNLAPTNPAKHNIIINTDNSASQQVLATGAGKDSVLTACAREIWLYAARHSCQIQVLHKPGKDLVLADALSRCSHDQTARQMASKITRDMGLAQIEVTFDDVFTAGL